MVERNDVKFLSNNIKSTNFKNTSMSSITNVVSKTAPLNDQNPEPVKKRLESMTDEEIIQKNLKELMDQRNREERKADGRMIAVIVASLVIFLAIYHAWIRKSGILAGVLVPAVIMLSFGGWVVVLAKRDKAKRQMFEKYLEEVALKNKQDLEAKSKLKSHKRKASNETLLHYKNEINNKQLPLLTHIGNSKITVTATTSILKNNNHRKQRKYRNGTNSDGCGATSSLSSKKMSHYTTKDLRVKRPSIRQKLFRQSCVHHMPGMTAKATQTLVQAVINTQVPQLINVPQHAPSPTLMEAKRKRLRKLNALQAPTMVCVSSIPKDKHT